MKQSNRALSVLALLAAFCLGLAACSSGGGCGGCGMDCIPDMDATCCGWDFYNECDLIEGAEQAGCDSCASPCAPRSPCAAPPAAGGSLPSGYIGR